MSKPWRPEHLTLAVSVLIVAVLNLPFWTRLHAAVAPEGARDWLFIAAVAVALLAIVNLVLTVFAWRPLWRVVLAVLLPTTAAVSYFMHEYGVVIDDNMVRNFFETDTREAGDLITVKLIAYVLALGVLPAVVAWLVPWQPRSFRQQAKSGVKVALVSLPIIATVLFAFWGDVLSTFREHRELRLTLAPYNTISGLRKYLRSKKIASAVKLEAFAADAKPAPGSVTERRRLFVIAVGETARWDHVQLNGYARETSPALSKVTDLINYPKAYSCGTDTAQSVPCMFSGLGRAAFSNAAAEARENLLDVLKRAGFDVIWRDNQAGCKGVCARVTSETLTGLKHPTFYAHSENHDEILLEGLADRIANLQRDTVIVLHMMGSHGPAYWKRYPERFEVFKPVCQKSQFSHCTREAIVNAYDNTLLYTDHVLSQLIALLKGADAHGVDAGMLYASDHGESLGEGNLYLHGMPYGIAPEAQIRVPMHAWLAPQWLTRLGVERACLMQKAGEVVSHDNLFHTTLGVLRVETSVYDPAQDLIGSCRAATVTAPN